MHGLVRAALDVKQFRFTLDDDLLDRVSRQYSAALLVLLAVLVSMRQYVGESIHCWCPEVCASNHEKYANMFCWVDNTYYVAVHDKMPQGNEGRDKRITYYQWVPIILLLQAALFLTPYAVWRMLSSLSGINVQVIMDSAVASHTGVYPEQREKTLRYSVYLINRYLMRAKKEDRTGCLAAVRHFLSTFCICYSGKSNGNFLTVSYLFVKLLYTANAVGQLFLLDLFLGYEYHVLGWQVLKHLILGEEWKASERFPRVTMCDYTVRQNTNVHRYTVQCVLPINLFNEKIFTLIWFWLFLIASITSISLLSWIFRMTCWSVQYRFIKSHLSLSLSRLSHTERSTLRRFVDTYLRRDGMLLIRLVGKNAGELVVTDILMSLWENFGSNHPLVERRRERKASGSNFKNWFKAHNKSPAQEDVSTKMEVV